MEKGGMMENNLRLWRKRAGMTQADAARALGLRSTSKISRWEAGLAYPSVPNLFRLAGAYGVPAGCLYGAAG